MAEMEMLERVARAMLERLKTAHAPYQEPPLVQGDIDDVLIDGSVDLRLVTRAAIEAMREPTERMGMEGLRAWDPDARGSVSDHLAANPALWMRPTWQAMIDAILKEEGQ